LFNNNNIFLTELEEAHLKQVCSVLAFQDYEDVRRVKPLVLSDVHILINSRGSSSVLGLLVAVIYTLGHDAILRAGEMTSDLRGRDIEFLKSPRGACVGMNLKLLRTKTHRKGGATVIPVMDYKSSHSAVRLMSRWSQVRDFDSFPDRILLPLITFKRGVPSGINFSKTLSYRALVQLLRYDLRMAGKDYLAYCGHSFRAGGATDLCMSKDITLPQIMLYGRWLTVTSAMKYFRAKDEAASIAAKVFGSLDDNITG
jgi:hypothetical protein